MFIIEEHVEVTEGKDAGKQGRIHGRDLKENIYYVYLLNEKLIEKYNPSQLMSLED